MNDKYLILKNKVIDMQSAIIGWRKKLAFNSEDDLISELEQMIEGALEHDLLCTRPADPENECTCGQEMTIET